MPRSGRHLLAMILVAGSVCALWADETVLTPQKKAHWAWRAPERLAVPSVRESAWVQNPVDAFVLAKLEERGLKPAPSADPATLLRRLYFDLIGLPPTPAEVDDFLRDVQASAKRQAGSSALNTPYSVVDQQAVAKVIDRLLASPHYGERWGRHWLDLARFAETDGFEHDDVRPSAWRYRDYVVRAFNQDKPYDRFILEQLAGDELFPDDQDARIATAFNLLGPDMADSSNQAQRRQNTLDDMTETTGLAFLGLTIGCARCHDHKFEPILQADFFRLQAFFAPARFRTDIPVANPATLAAHAQAQKRYQDLIRPTLDLLAKIEAPYRSKVFERKLSLIADEARQAHLTPAEKRTKRQDELVNQTARLLAVSSTEVIAAMSAADKASHQQTQQELKKFDADKPASLPVTLGLEDDLKPVKTRLLVRGELRQPAEEVEPAWPLILSPKFQETRPTIAAPRPQTTGRRAALARWITAPEHPLTARVLVNRLWHHHFGRGIVATPSDFGVRGEPPSHAELLDWLASEFVSPSDAPGQGLGRKAWSIKRMHRLILQSATYQQATTASEGALKKDPDNVLLSCMNRRRLEGEIIRDSLLAVSGRLNRKLGGPGVFPPLPTETRVTAKEWPTSTKVEDQTRRSIYIFARRNLRHPFLATFDLPDSNQSCAERQRSTTGPQALALFNSADATAAARALAERLTKQSSAADERIVGAFRHALARRPSAEELEWSREFLRQAPLAELCRALLNANEFVYVD